MSNTEKFEFTSLGSVGVVEEVSETATVLIEEGGAIKRAPKSQVGGGSSNWDAEIEVDRINYVNTLISGNYNDIYNKIMNGEAPNIKIKVIAEYADDVETNIQKATIVSVITDYNNNHSIRIQYSGYINNTNGWVSWSEDGLY